MGGTTKAPWPWTSDRSVTGGEFAKFAERLGEGLPLRLWLRPLGWWQGRDGSGLKQIAEARCGNM